MRSVAGELQSLSQAFRKSQGQYLKRAFIKGSRSQCSGSDLDSSSIQDSRTQSTCDNIFAHSFSICPWSMTLPGMKGREDREKDYGFAAELGEAGAATAEDDIDFDTVVLDEKTIGLSLSQPRTTRIGRSSS